MAVGDLATESTLQKLVGMASPVDTNASLVSGANKRYRKEFVAAADLTNNFDTTVTGGMTAAVTGGALVVTTGTTTNATAEVRSKDSFTIPIKAMVGVRLSQKIANQAFFVELVALDGAGAVDETVVAAWRLNGDDSTTATTARYEVRNGQAARTTSANQTVTSHVAADALLEIGLESDEVWFHSKGTNNTGTKGNSYVQNLTAPDPNRLYKIRVRAVNGGTAPASSTTMTVYMFSVVDLTEFAVEVTGGTGSVTSAQGVPVNVTNNISTLPIAASATVGGLTIAKVNSAATTNATLVKSTAGRVYGYEFLNTSASPRYVKLFNKTTAPVPGTDTPAQVIGIPAGARAMVNLTVPITFATGIGYSVVTGALDNDATAVGAQEVIGSIWYS